MSRSAIALAFTSSLGLRQEGSRSLDLNSILTIRGRPHLQQDNSIAPLCFQLFFGASRRLSATLGGIHPGLPKGKIHPSTKDGLQSLIRHLELGAPNHVNRLAAEKLIGSAAILGGPVANLHARLVMGCNGPSPLFGKYLPIHFYCPTASRNDDAPWEIVVDGRRSPKECLLITSVPMSAQKDRLTIFAGLHGAGTRAIELVLKDPSLLERMERQTRNLHAWQAIIAVESRNKIIPMSLGDLKIAEISAIDFDNPTNHICDRLVLGEENINKLIALLPPRHQIDFTDPAVTGIDKIINIEDYKSTQQNIPDILEIGMARAPTSPRNLGRLISRSEAGAVDEPLYPKEAHMNKPKEIGEAWPRRRLGRPPKEKNKMSLTKSLLITLSERDVEMINEIMGITGVASMAQVIRDSIRMNHRSLVDENRG